MKRTNQRKHFQTIMATILSATMIAGLVPPQALAEMAEEAGSASWVSTENGAVLSASSEDGGAPIEGSSEDDTLQGDGNGEGLGDESQSETGALEVSFALQGVDEEDAANKSVRYILRNEEGAYFNNQDE